MSWKRNTYFFLTFLVSMWIIFSILLDYLNTRSSWGLHTGMDYYFFYYSFEMVWHHMPASSLYNHDYQLQQIKYLGLRNFSPNMFFGYPPIFALLFSPLATFPLKLSGTVWQVLSTILFVLGLLFLITSVTQNLKNKKTLVLMRLVLVAIAFSFTPLEFEFFYGQANRIVFFLLAIMVYLRLRQKPLLAGLMLGLSIFIKVTPIVVVFALLFRKTEIKMILGTLVTFIVGNFISVLYMGFWGVMRYWFVQLPQFSDLTYSINPAPWNSSFKGLLEWVSMQISGHTAVWWVSVGYDIFVFFFLLFLILYMLNTPLDFLEDISIAITTMLIVSPVLEVHHYLLLLIPLTIRIGKIELNRQTWFGSFLEVLIGTFAILLFVTLNLHDEYFIALLLIYIWNILSVRKRITVTWGNRSHDGLSPMLVFQEISSSDTET